MLIGTSEWEREMDAKHAALWGDSPLGSSHKMVKDGVEWSFYSVWAQSWVRIVSPKGCMEDLARVQAEFLHSRLVNEGFVSAPIIAVDR